MLYACPCSHQVFDLKGSMRSRYIDPSKYSSSDVLLDENYLNRESITVLRLCSVCVKRVWSHDVCVFTVHVLHSLSILCMFTCLLHSLCSPLHSLTILCCLTYSTCKCTFCLPFRHCVTVQVHMYCIIIHVHVQTTL